MIHVYSELGSGHHLPDLSPLRGPGGHAAPAGAAGELVGGSETLLLAEDDRVLRNATAKLLARLGYRIIPVATGREALDTIVALRQGDRPGDARRRHAGDERPHRVRRRREAASPNLRFLFTTGYSPAAFNIGGLQAAGSVEVLHKPYGFADLARAVRRALDPAVPAA